MANIDLGVFMFTESMWRELDGRMIVNEFANKLDRVKDQLQPGDELTITVRIKETTK